MKEILNIFNLKHYDKDISMFMRRANKKDMENTKRHGNNIWSIPEEAKEVMCALYVWVG